VFEQGEVQVVVALGSQVGVWAMELLWSLSRRHWTDDRTPLYASISCWCAILSSADPCIPIAYDLASHEGLRSGARSMLWWSRLPGAIGLLRPNRELLASCNNALARNKLAGASLLLDLPSARRCKRSSFDCWRLPSIGMAELGPSVP
jgi:hypothetical protein